MSSDIDVDPQPRVLPEQYSATKWNENRTKQRENEKETQKHEQKWKIAVKITRRWSTAEARQEKIQRCVVFFPAEGQKTNKTKEQHATTINNINRMI